MPNTTQLPMSASPPGAVPLIYGDFVPPPGSDLSEWESGPPTIFTGPTWPSNFTPRLADPVPPPQVQGRYLLLGPGMTPGYTPSLPFGPGRSFLIPGSSPWWQTEEPETPGDTVFCYAGLDGTNFAEFYTDLCPNGSNHVHRFYQHPSTDFADGRVYGQFMCYAGPTPVLVKLLFAGANVEVPGNTLAAINQGWLIGS